MKLEIAYLLALCLQWAAPSPTSSLAKGYGGLSRTLESRSIDVPSNDSALLVDRSDASGDVEMGGMDGQDYIIQDSPARSPSPAQDPVLPELTEATAQELIRKGAKLYGWMIEPSTERLTQLLRQDNKLGPGDSLQSSFTRYPQDLEAAGWEINPAAADAGESNFGKAIPLKRMVEGLGMSSTWSIRPCLEGDNEFVTWNHVDSNFDGKEHDIPTGAFYSSVYNSKDGVIMFASSYGPKEELPKEAYVEFEDRGAEFVQKFVDEYEYPKLSHVSDVSALEYGAQCSKRGHSTKGLSKLVMVASQSDRTVQVVDYLLKKKGIQPMPNPRPAGRYKAPDWDHRVTYEAGTDEFNLLLANQNGNLATFLLIQHRQAFGLKRVSKIDVFDDDHYDVSPQQGYKGASMVYYLENLDIKSNPLAPAVASGSGSGKNKPKPGGSGSKSNRIEKAKSGGGRQGLRLGNKGQGKAKL